MINVCKINIPIKSLEYCRIMNDFIGAKVFNLAVSTDLYYVSQIAEGDSRMLCIKVAIDKLKYGKQSCNFEE